MTFNPGKPSSGNINPPSILKQAKTVTFDSPVFSYLEPRPPHADPKQASIATSAGKDEDSSAVSSSESEMSSSAEDSEEWSRKQDRIICRLRADEKSWGAISRATKRSKVDCQHRYRYLASHFRELRMTTKELADFYTQQYKTEKKAAKAEAKEKNAQDTDNSSEGKGKTDSENEDHSPKKSKNKKKNQGSGSNGKAKGKSQGDNKKAKNHQSPSEDDGDDIDSSSSSSSSSEPEPEPEHDPYVEFWAQRRFHYETVIAMEFPPRKTLKADQHFSESDCRIIANLEARHRGTKWIQIQSDFCNATGMMIEAEILKAKFYEDKE
ncbi:hypothetical protein F5Y16DRAFT_218949 [Xylariaceae sp. FL0255]|nr:hypothetical protein F5Y16DRAFT_218949 [Xylariaceae sp. FL0255]